MKVRPLKAGCREKGYAKPWGLEQQFARRHPPRMHLSLRPPSSSWFIDQRSKAVILPALSAGTGPMAEITKNHL